MAARTGAAILRVHVHDTRSAACGVDRSQCDAAVVVEAIVWNGDNQTEPHPLTSEDVEAALKGLRASVRLTSPGFRRRTRAPLR